MNPCDLGPIPDDWIVAPTLPQVAMLRGADLAIHHGGNNSVQESLAAGVRQLVLPMSTDQFANAADLEHDRRGGGRLTEHQLRRRPGCDDRRAPPHATPVAPQRALISATTSV